MYEKIKKRIKENVIFLCVRKEPELDLLGALSMIMAWCTWTRWRK